MIVQIAFKQVKGQEVKVELNTENGILIYEVGIKTNYRIYEIDVDAYQN